MLFKKPKDQPRAKPGKPKLPKNLTPDYVRRAFPDREMNVNVATMAHLHLAAKILDHLVEREIINFGTETNKTEEAKEVSKQIKRFLNRLTLAHERGETLSFEEFGQEVQGEADAAAVKLHAILDQGDRRLGAEDAELAQPLSQGMKCLIALTLRGVADLFAIAGEKRAAIEAHIDKRGQEGDAVGAFVKELQETIPNGNGTRSYRYLRIAAASIAELSRDGEGAADVGRRVGAAIEAHGTLAHDLMSFADVPEIEETIENLDCLFDMETLTVDKHGGAMALAAAAIFDGLRIGLTQTDDFKRAVDAAAAALDDDTWTALIGKGASEREALENYSDFLHTECLKLAADFAGSGLMHTTQSRAKAFQNVVGQSAAVFKSVSDSATFCERGGEAMADAKALRLRLFLEIAAGRLESAAKFGSVMLSDRDIPHAQSKSPLVEQMIHELGQSVATLSGKGGFVAGPPSGLTLTKAKDLATRLLTFFSHTAIYRANTDG